MDLDEFSDDGFDDLTDNVLQELESRAIQFTQGPPKEQSQLPGSAYDDAIWVEDDDLDTTEVTDDVGVPIGRPVVGGNLRQSSQSQQQQPPQQQYSAEPRRSMPPPNPKWNPVIDPTKRQPTGAPMAIRPPNPAPTHQQIYTSQQFQSQTANVARPPAGHFVRPPIPTNRFGGLEPSQHHNAEPASALQERIRTLEAQLNAARGEVTIIRNNSTKAQQQHDAEVGRLKKLNAEQLAKQERIAEAALAAEESANTELQFLQRDMREVSDRARRKDQPAAGAATTTATATTTTPKKATKMWRVADGFDDMEIVASPTKSQGRSKNATTIATNVGERTPTKGKRKRPLVDSPIMELETHTDDFTTADDGARVHGGQTSQQPIIVEAAAAALPFEFLPLALDHVAVNENTPTFDVLSRLYFPTEPETSISALMFQRFPLLGTPQQPMQLLVDFVEVVMGNWNRCVNEQYWEPIKYLVSLITFTFQLHATEVGHLTIGSLGPVAQATIFNLAEPRHLIKEEDRAKDQQYRLLNEHINITDVLSLLYVSALVCATTIEETDAGVETKAAHFWQHINFSLPSLLLSPKQDLADVLGMLGLLATSSLPDSLGPITTEEEPEFVARVMIEHVASKLTQFPRAAKTQADKRRVQLAALRTLFAFARYPFGAMQLARNSMAIPRLVTCLGTTIDQLYDQQMPASIFPPVSDAQGPDGQQDQGSSSTDLYRIIAQCVKLIHFLVTSPQTANVAEISQKLSTSHGGSQRYLLALGRLTFAEEDLVMETGIDGETVEAAHELLELAVTPDEGEIVSEAFGG